MGFSSQSTKTTPSTPVYSPQNLPGIDTLLASLMQQQAGMSNPMGQYQPLANSLLSQYASAIGQSYQTPGTYAPDVTTQTLNPAYTSWQNQQSQVAPLTPEEIQIQQITGGYSNPAGGSSSTPAPEQYITTTTPGAYTPGQTIQPTGPNYMEYLSKYLTGAFNNPQSDVYNQLLQNTQQGSRSAASARGLNASPYGAGLESEAIRQMNLSWAQDAQNRQREALQNYMSGQQGIQGLGQNALSIATQLEALKKGWNQQDIANMMNYIGIGSGQQIGGSSSSSGFGLDFGKVVLPK